jgi:hypothetical protein
MGRRTKTCQANAHCTTPHNHRGGLTTKTLANLNDEFSAMQLVRTEGPKG